MDVLTTEKLREALPLPGCGICRIGDAGGRHYLSTLLHEYVNDFETRARLADSWGFCRYHAWGFLAVEWARFQDGMSTANLTQWQIGRLRQLLRETRGLPVTGSRLGRLGKSGGTLQSTLRARLEPTRECPACHSQRQTEAYALGVLLEQLREGGELLPLFRGSASLCLDHVRMALDARDRASGIHILLEIEQAKLDALDQELEEYLRKHDHRFSHEPYGSEIDAFVRATAVLAGSWSDLAGRAASDVWHERRAELPPGSQAAVCSVCRAARPRQEAWGRLEDPEVAVCAECVERWATTGRRCAACAKPVGPDEVAYVPARRGLGHLRCGGLGLRRPP